jgi:ABC-2 type transport system permease protein
MRKTWLIIKREYVTRVKSKGFIISTIIVPLIGFGFFAMTAFLATRQPTSSLRLAILDESGSLGPAIASGLDAKLPDGTPEFNIVETIDSAGDSASRPVETTEQDLRGQINSGQLDAYLLIPRDPDQPFDFHTRNPSNFAQRGPLTNAVTHALVAQRLSARGIHVGDVGALLQGADLRFIKVTKNGESVERGQSAGIAIVLVMLLYMSLLMYGIITMRSVLEEKTTRTMEVLIAAVRPFQLLSGKILGVAAAAFTQFVIWAITFGVALSYGALMSAGTQGSVFSGVRIPISVFIFAGVYFIGGYFLYSSMHAAIGAACSNEQDAQQLQWPATLPLIFSALVFSMILADPASRLSVILSEIPFFAPILMTLRIAIQTPPAWQIALSIVLLVATTIGMIYGSARIYRVGVLMYGKRPYFTNTCSCGAFVQLRSLKSSNEHE